MALIAGTFVLVSGAVYYAFMAAWLNVFLVIGISTALRWVLGGMALAIGGINVKDFFVWGRGFSLSVPASVKPGLYARMRAVLSADTLLPALMAVAVLAVMVNFIELLCTSRFPGDIYRCAGPARSEPASALCLFGSLHPWLHS